MTRFFLVLGAILAVPAVIVSLVVRSWLPLVALGVVVGGVMAVSLSELALFKPLLALIMRAGSGKKPSAPPPPDEHEQKNPQTHGFTNGERK